MTQYLHTITLTDSERIAVEDALDMLLRKCRRRQHWGGAGVPINSDKARAVDADAAEHLRSV